MILSIGYMLIFLIFGMMSVQWLLPGHRPLNRLWLGLSLGVLEMMWLPALFSFAFSFSVKAHLLALIPLSTLS